MNRGDAVAATWIHIPRRRVAAPPRLRRVSVHCRFTHYWSPASDRLVELAGDDGFGRRARRVRGRFGGRRGGELDGPRDDEPVDLLLGARGFGRREFDVAERVARAVAAVDAPEDRGKLASSRVDEEDLRTSRRFFS